MKVTGTWNDPTTGLPLDPSNASVDIVDPAGKTTTYTFLNSQTTRVSAGVYIYIVDTTAKPGRYQYRWWSPAPVGQGASINTFFVDPFPSPIP